VQLSSYLFVQLMNPDEGCHVFNWHSSDVVVDVLVLVVALVGVSSVCSSIVLTVFEHEFSTTQSLP
jgi:hypothetical protein